MGAPARAPTQDTSPMGAGSQPEDLRQAFARARDLDGSMGERLATFAEAVRVQQPGFARTVDEFVGRLRERSVGDSAPKPDEPMPPFMLPDENGRMVSLAELLERGPVVASF